MRRYKACSEYLKNDCDELYDKYWRKIKVRRHFGKMRSVM